MVTTVAIQNTGDRTTTDPCFTGDSDLSSRSGYGLATDNELSALCDSLLADAKLTSEQLAAVSAALRTAGLKLPTLEAKSENT